MRKRDRYSSLMLSLTERESARVRVDTRWIFRRHVSSGFEIILKFCEYSSWIELNIMLLPISLWDLVFPGSVWLVCAYAFPFVWLEGLEQTSIVIIYSDCITLNWFFFRRLNVLFCIIFSFDNDFVFMLSSE